MPIRTRYTLNHMFSPLLTSFHDTPDPLALQALESVDIYICLLTAGITVALAWLLSLLGRRLAERGKHGAPPLWMRKSFPLLTPLLSVLIMSATQPVAASFLEDSENTELLGGINALFVAWLVCRAVLLMVESRIMAWFISAVVVLYTALSATGYMKSTAAYLSGMAFEFGKVKLSMLHIVQGVIIFVIVFWLAGLASRTAETQLRRSTALSYSARELIVKFFKLFVYFVALLITLGAMGVDLTAFAVFGGALGVGVGLGLQKITSNFVSGIIILIEKSVKIGDLVEVGNFTGYVRQLQMRYTLIETFDGREVLVPNEELISTRVTNWTYSNEQARVEIRVPIPYGADARKVRDLLLQAALSHPLCLKNPEPFCHLQEFGENGMFFRLTFWIANINEGRGGPQSEVMLDILDRLNAAGIALEPGVGKKAI